MAFREVNGYPEIGEWYGPVKLGMTLRVFYKALAARRLKPSSEVSVDEQFAASEWGAGGITHHRRLLRAPTLHG